MPFDLSSPATTDNVFSDGASLELASISGGLSSGFTATLTVAV
jgi:hypothetical protein